MRDEEASAPAPPIQGNSSTKIIGLSNKVKSSCAMNLAKIRESNAKKFMGENRNIRSSDIHLKSCLCAWPRVWGLYTQGLGRTHRSASIVLLAYKPAEVLHAEPENVLRATGWSGTTSLSMEHLHLR